MKIDVLFFSRILLHVYDRHWFHLFDYSFLLFSTTTIIIFSNNRIRHKQRHRLRKANERRLIRSWFFQKWTLIWFWTHFIVDLYSTSDNDFRPRQWSRWQLRIIQSIRYRQVDNVKFDRIWHETQWRIWDLNNSRHLRIRSESKHNDKSLLYEMIVRSRFLIKFEVIVRSW
jgi:hypothetical protein